MTHTSLARRQTAGPPGCGLLAGERPRRRKGTHTGSRSPTRLPTPAHSQGEETPPSGSPGSPRGALGHAYYHRPRPSRASPPTHRAETQGFTQVPDRLRALWPRLPALATPIARVPAHSQSSEKPPRGSPGTPRNPLGHAHSPWSRLLPRGPAHSVPRDVASPKSRTASGRSGPVYPPQPRPLARHPLYHSAEKRRLTEVPDRPLQDAPAPPTSSGPAHSPWPRLLARDPLSQRAERNRLAEV